jgi:late competence protein required for DNA uptake (superfamily II DNA/RNA helicase)
MPLLPQLIPSFLWLNEWHGCFAQQQLHLPVQLFLQEHADGGKRGEVWDMGDKE